jgi:hypothetical protein
MPQPIQAGKNDPRILNEGAREHPAANNGVANDAPIAAVRFVPRPSGVREFPVNFSTPRAVSFGDIGLWPFRVQQVACLKR